MFILQMSVINNPAHTKAEISPFLTPVGLLGKNPRTKSEIEKLASERNLHPLVMQPLLSVIGEALVGIGGANLLTTKQNGIFGYFTTLVGLGITAAGFLFQDSFNITNKKKEQEPPKAEVPPPEPTPGPTPPDPGKSPDPEPVPPPILPPTPENPPDPLPPSAEEDLFNKLIEETTALKVSILEEDLELSEERGKVTRLLEILRDTTGHKTGLKSPDNHNQSKLREYTLNLLQDIIINSTNNQTIKRSIKAIFEIFTKDTRDEIKVEAGIALVLINKQPGGPEKLTKFIPDDSGTLEEIIKRLESL